jgi:N6-adenosine-specific RNA methylase IME4
MTFTEPKRYRTIVADPPWHYERFGISRIPKGVEHDGRAKTLPYASMAVEEIKALPVASLADPEGAHLYLWTTNRYLRDAFDVMEAWGFRYGQTVVWAKKFKGGVIGGAFPMNVEFVLFGRRGSLRHLKRAPSQWFQWPRSETHSRKPDAFLDLVEQTSPGPYVELFARRARFGWDYWGDESLGTAEMAA